MNTNKKIYFVTGVFVNNNSWSNWKSHFESMGYKVDIPLWPCKNKTSDTINPKYTDLVLGDLTSSQLLNYYIEIIKQEKEKPIAIGHSLGGLIVQLLLQADILSIGVAIHSVPPKGVFSFQFSFFKSLWTPFYLFKSEKMPHFMSFQEWQDAYPNDKSYKEQKESYDKILIPESRKIITEFLTKSAKIKFTLKKQPLLFVAGSNDNLMPANLNFKNYKKYKHASSITDFKEFEDLNHFVLGGKKWKEVTDYIIRWLKQHDN